MTIIDTDVEKLNLNKVPVHEHKGANLDNSQLEFEELDAKPNAMDVAMAPAAEQPTPAPAEQPTPAPAEPVEQPAPATDDTATPLEGDGTENLSPDAKQELEELEIALGIKEKQIDAKKQEIEQAAKAWDAVVVDQKVMELQSLIQQKDKQLDMMKQQQDKTLEDKFSMEAEMHEKNKVYNLLMDDDSLKRLAFLKKQSDVNPVKKQQYIDTLQEMYEQASGVPITDMQEQIKQYEKQWLANQWWAYNTGPTVQWKGAYDDMFEDLS